MKLYRISLILLLLLYSCSNDDSHADGNSDEYEAGIVLTLDDDYVGNWADAHEILKDFDWRATFFVTKFDELTTEEINSLANFKNYGHEIAAHGLNHLDAVAYTAKNGETAYLEQEIYPMVSMMQQNGLYPTSFAYPFGKRNATTDALLLNEFTMLRGTVYGRPDPAHHNCYYTGNRIVYGLGLDNSYAHFDTGYFLSLLNYARDHNKIIIFYAHRTVAHATADYETEFQTLIDICNYAKVNHMKFYTISELASLQ